MPAATAQIKRLLEEVKVELDQHAVHAELHHATSIVRSALHLESYWRARCQRLEQLALDAGAQPAVPPPVPPELPILADGPRELAALYFPEDGVNLEEELSTLERRYLARSLLRSHGVQTRAARLLGMSFRSFRYKLRKHDLLGQVALPQAVRSLRPAPPARGPRPDNPRICLCGRPTRHRGRCWGIPITRGVADARSGA